MAMALFATVVALLCAPRAPGWYWSWRTDNPVRRGATLAAKEGCLSCHGPTGRDETANPGSRWGTVPSFFRGNAMMYVKSPSQVETFIRDGDPEGRAEKDRGGYTPDPGTKPDAPFHMRGFGDRLSRGQVRDLAAYVLAADGYLVPADGPVARGASLSGKFGCEGCHGVGGSGGVSNPRSFTGMVPGWTGPAFEHLVSGEPEFREWVLQGRSRQMAASRAASFFLNRANLYMPAFRSSLSEADTSDLWAYVQWLRHRTPAGGDGPSAAPKE